MHLATKKQQQKNKLTIIQYSCDLLNNELNNVNVIQYSVHTQFA